MIKDVIIRKRDRVFYRVRAMYKSPAPIAGMRFLGSTFHPSIRRVWVICQPKNGNQVRVSQWSFRADLVISPPIVEGPDLSERPPVAAYTRQSCGKRVFIGAMEILVVLIAPREFRA